MPAGNNRDPAGPDVAPTGRGTGERAFDRGRSRAGWAGADHGDGRPLRTGRWPRCGRLGCGRLAPDGFGHGRLGRDRLGREQFRCSELGSDRLGRNRLGRDRRPCSELGRDMLRAIGRSGDTRLRYGRPRCRVVRPLLSRRPGRDRPRDLTGRGGPWLLDSRCGWGRRCRGSWNGPVLCWSGWPGRPAGRRAWQRTWRPCRRRCGGPADGSARYPRGQCTRVAGRCLRLPGKNPRSPEPERPSACPRRRSRDSRGLRRQGLDGRGRGHRFRGNCFLRPAAGPGSPDAPAHDHDVTLGQRRHPAQHSRLRQVTQLRLDQLGQPLALEHGTGGEPGRQARGQYVKPDQRVIERKTEHRQEHHIRHGNSREHRDLANGKRHGQPKIVQLV